MRYLTLSLIFISLSSVQCQGPPNPIGYGPSNPVSDTGPGIGTPSSESDSGGPPAVSTPVPRACPAERLQGHKEDPLLVNDPACPTDNGDIFTTPDGAHFAYQCCSHHPDEAGQKIPDTETNQPSMKACAEQCTKKAGCQSIIFTQVSHGAELRGTCKLFRSEGYSSAACGDDMHDYAYMRSPPAIEIPEPLTNLCSTECPHADGQRYTAKYGEAFMIHCGKRHGTEVIHQDSRESLQDCMDACSRLLPCHSVDFHLSSKICYYGKRHSEPQIEASGFASARSAGCAGACDVSKACCQEGNSAQLAN